MHGIFVFTTTDDPDAVARFFADGCPWSSSTSNSSYHVNDMKHASRSFSGQGRRLKIEISGDGKEPSFVIVEFEE